MTFRDEQYRQIFEELVELHSEVAEATFRKGFMKAGHVAHGWYLRVQRGGQAVFLLNDEGFIGEAAPLRRSILEHTIALHWLSAEGDTVFETLKSGHGSSVARIKKALEETAWDDFTQIDLTLQDVADADHSNDNLLKSLHRIQKYGNAHDVTQYLSETQLSHPTYESGITYFDAKSHEMLSESHSTLDPSGFCAVHLALAFSFFMSLFDPIPMESQLTDIADRLKRIDIDYRLETGMKIPPEYDDLSNPRTVDR
jgi:hypothetical protein